MGGRAIKDLLAYNEILEKALEDGFISEDERALLDNISKNYESYEKSLQEVIRGGLITDGGAKELKDLRKKMYDDAMKVALADRVITDEEKVILDKLKEALGLDFSSQMLIEEREQVKRRVKHN